MHRNLPARPATPTTSLTAHHHTPDGAKIVVEHHHYHHDLEPTPGANQTPAPAQQDNPYRAADRRFAVVWVTLFGVFATIAVFDARAAAAVVIATLTTCLVLAITYRKAIR